jgi:hypothetical protein
MIIKVTRIASLSVLMQRFGSTVRECDLDCWILIRVIGRFAQDRTLLLVEERALRPALQFLALRSLF